MSIKGIGRNYALRRYEYSGVLDRSITIKDLLKYTGYGLLILIALFIMILIPFMIGRASVDCGGLADKSTTNKTARVAAATSLISEAAEETEERPDDMTVPSAPEAEPEDDIPAEPEEEIIEQEDSPEDLSIAYDETARYLRTDPRVATTYDDVDIDLLDYEYNIRGLDWGTISKVKLIIKNNQDKLVLPYTLKLKMYNVGENPSQWWDDEINLRDQINIITPDGGYKIIEVPAHVSFSEIDEKKRFGLYLFDEVGKEMAGRVKEITIDPYG